MTQQEKHAIGAATAPLCAWRTGNRRCLIPLSSGVRCQWHTHWMRLVYVGELHEGQETAFRAWWAQFQPTGLYAENPGPWWADADLLWYCLTGQSDAPKLTDVLARELYIRRAEVRRYLSGLPMGETPWDRVHGLPLPTWITEEWQEKLNTASTEASHG